MPWEFPEARCLSEQVGGSSGPGQRRMRQPPQMPSSALSCFRLVEICGGQLDPCVPRPSTPWVVVVLDSLREEAPSPPGGWGQRGQRWTGA